MGVLSQHPQSDPSAGWHHRFTTTPQRTVITKTAPAPHQAPLGQKNIFFGSQSKPPKRFAIFGPPKGACGVFPKMAARVVWISQTLRGDSHLVTCPRGDAYCCVERCTWKNILQQPQPGPDCCSVTRNVVQLEERLEMDADSLHWNEITTVPQIMGCLKDGVVPLGPLVEAPQQWKDPGHQNGNSLCRKIGENVERDNETRQFSFS